MSVRMDAGDLPDQQVIAFMPGDTIVLSPMEDDDGLEVQPGFFEVGAPLPRIVVGDESPIPSLDWTEDGRLCLRLSQGLPYGPFLARLVALEPDVFQLEIEHADDSFRDEDWQTEGGQTIVLAGAEDGEALYARALESIGPYEFELAGRASKMAIHGGFHQLIALPLVREMEVLEHQVRTAKTVLRRFRGRALLCDEVGLGKTIEAGLILSELSVRGLVRSALILTPPSLVEQWQSELTRKFSLSFTTYDDPSFKLRGKDAWNEFNTIIASAHTAKREPHRSAILGRRWDIVIVDEAHHLRNRATMLWKFASEIQKQYILLLTATPVQNNLDELFNLVTLLEPGLLRTAKQFQKRFVDRKDKLAPKNVEELHDLLAEVMVRNRRGSVGLQFTRRWATTLCVQPTKDEESLYRDVTKFVKSRLSASGPSDGDDGEDENAPARKGIARMALVALQMALGSSSPAAASTLQTIADNPRLDEATRKQLRALAERAASLPPGAKVARLLSLLDEVRDKLVLFTQFRATQELLARELQQAGHAISVFHGGLTRVQKEAAITAFKGSANILLCTEAGSEGRNLQFAHALCNFDLPWNPMKIEQRIGRLSRIGQSRDVLVYNLVAAGTVESAVLHVLDAKLSMFELVIGEIDMILGNMEGDREFQDIVADLWAGSADEEDFSGRMETLATRMLDAKQRYLDQRAHDEKLFGSRFAPEG